MTRHDLDPLPGDFDHELEDLDPADVQVMEASRDRSLVVQFTLDGGNTSEALSE